MAQDTTLEKRGSEDIVQREPTRNARYYRPNVDILEKEDALVVRADVPGARPEDIDVDFENGTLTLRACVRDRQSENTNYLLREYGVGDFVRNFQVSETIDARKITAECNDGVLTLHLPKVEAARPRKIAVKAK